MKKSSIFSLLLGVLLIFLISCKEEETATIPTVKIASITNITATTATSGGEITSDGGTPVTARGVCWGNNPDPLITENKTSDGAGSGNFISSITGLTPGVSYYIRAYAINAVGTAYSSQATFNASAMLPVLSTTSASETTSNSTITGGNITDDGGAPITARGVCWATTSSPSINNNKTTEGTGTGSFASTITELTPLTTYYIRAYATNSAGTAYGNELTVTTLESQPTTPYIKSTSTYNSQGRRIEEIIYVRDEATGNWVNYTKSTFSYFAFKKMWDEIEYRWDDASNQWPNHEKFDDYWSSSNSKSLQRTLYMWDSNRWKEYNGYSYSFSFDNEGRIKQQIEQDKNGYWDSRVSMWLNRKVRTDFIYDSKGIEIDVKSSSYDVVWGWSASEHYVSFTYDENGNPIEKIIKTWYSSLSKFVVTGKIVYSYDSNGYQTGYIMYVL